MSPGLLVSLSLLTAGCAPADRYKANPPKKADASNTDKSDKPYRPRSLPADYAWMPPDPKAMKGDVIPIVFVHEETSPEEWNKLRSFWTLEPAPNPQQAVSLLGLRPVILGPAAAVPATRVAKIKIPSGLDPVGPEQLPASNPPTVAKWELGKRLFFDKNYLQPADALGGQSCAGCHQPSLGYTDNRVEPPGFRVNTPTLINAVYNKFLFWDGRASSLEEVVQRVLEDEREPWGDEEGRPHVWSGVIKRLRERPEYDKRFREVFGTPPTQDALGKALATYLRTILSGGSLHDRAERSRKERKGQTLEPADYEKFLDESAIRSVLLEAPAEKDLPKKEEVAQQLHAGYTLFHGKGRCVRCHSGANFTDNGFHNVGVGWLGGTRYPAGNEPGRFAALPIGRKDLGMAGAYKTPTLRALIRTQPYFHDGLRFAPEEKGIGLFDAIAFHTSTKDKADNPYLDPELRDPENPLRHRDLGLSEQDVRALVMFLRSLEGEPTDPVIAAPTQWPEGTGGGGR